VAIKKSELIRGKKYFYFYIFKIGWVSEFTSMQFYLVEYEKVGPADHYFFRVVKDYSEIFQGGRVPNWSGKQTYRFLKHVYKENYKTMKRRFIRAVLEPGR